MGRPERRSPGGRSPIARLVFGGVWLLSAGAFAACSLSTNIDRFDNGICPVGTKACNQICSSETDPNVGCQSPGCAACDLANALAFCVDGTCAVQQCIGANRNCDHVANNGCEADLDHDPINCGDCGCRCGTGDFTNCTHGQNATPIWNGIAGCSAGQCTAGECDPGWGDCNGALIDGCETHTNSEANCGTCGTACAGPASCVCPEQNGNTGCACRSLDGGAE